MSSLIRSISGIRGIPGETLQPQTIVTYVGAFTAYCGEGPIVIGFDGRPSGWACKNLVTGTLMLHGRDVIDLGMAPTPSIQLITEHSDAAGGISITASHNPGEWNGLKFLDSTGIFLDAEQNAELFALADMGQFPSTSWHALGRIEERSCIDQHIDRVLALSILDITAIRSRRFKVVVDAVNASGSVVIPTLLERCGCDVVKLFCDGSGVFPHTPEPLPEHLGDLGRAVLEHGADLGIAVDPDADRLVLFNELGQPFGEEYTISAAVDSVLSKMEPGQTVVVNLSTTRAVEDIAHRYGAAVHRTPVGEINVVKHMLELGAVIGGEGSGGVIMPQVHAGRDALVGITLVLDRLASMGISPSAYGASLPRYVIRKSRYGTGGVNDRGLLDRLTEHFAGERVNTEDGVRIDFEEGWVHVRSSNTEPLVRVISEARDESSAETLARRVAAVAFEPQSVVPS